MTADLICRKKSNPGWIDFEDYSGDCRIWMVFKLSKIMIAQPFFLDKMAKPNDRFFWWGNLFFRIYFL